LPPLIDPPPTASLCPYTTLFRSSDESDKPAKPRRKRPSRKAKVDKSTKKDDQPSEDQNESPSSTDREAELEQYWMELVDSCSTPRSRRIMEGATYSLAEGDLVVLSDGTIPQSVKRRVKETFSDFHCSFETRGR